MAIAEVAIRRAVPLDADSLEKLKNLAVDLPQACQQYDWRSAAAKQTLPRVEPRVSALTSEDSSGDARSVLINVASSCERRGLSRADIVNSFDNDLMAFMTSAKTLSRAQIESALLDLAGIPDLAHGEIITIKVTRFVRRGSTVVELPTPIRVRIIGNKSDFSVSPQFALMKRLSDVAPSATASTGELPVNFTPVPGVGLTWQHRTRVAWLDWLIPSIGLVASTAQFRTSRPADIGLALTLGLANGNVHVGLGLDLMELPNVSRANYFFLGLDFARTVSTLQAVLGGPAQ